MRALRIEIAFTLEGVPATVLQSLWRLLQEAPIGPRHDTPSALAQSLMISILTADDRGDNHLSH